MASIQRTFIKYAFNGKQSGYEVSDPKNRVDASLGLSLLLPGVHLEN